MGKASIDLADRLTDQILYGSVVRSLRLRRLAVERDQRRHEGAAFTEHDCVGNPGTAAQHVLDRSGCDIFSSGGLEQVLLAVCDLEIAVRVELTDVARFQPSVGERLPRLLRILVVAGENVVAANQDLSILGDSNLNPWQRHSHRPEFRFPGPVEGGGRGGLGQAITFEDLETDPVEEADDLGRYRRRSAHTDQDLIEAQGFSNSLEDEPVGQFPLPAQETGCWPARLVGGRPAGRHPERPVADQPARPVNRVQPYLNARVDFFPEARHRGEIGRVHLTHHLHHLVRIRTEIDLAARAELSQLAHHPFQDVSQGKVGNHAVLGRAGEAFQRVLSRPGQVSVREDGRLWGSRRAGGVDQAGHIVRPHRLPPAGQQPRAVASECVTPAQCFRPGDHPAVQLRRIAFDQDHPFQGREFVAQSGDLVEQVPVGHDQDLRFGVVEQVGHLIGSKGWIDRHRHRPGMQDAEVRDLPLRTVGRPDGDPVLGAEPLVQDRVAQAADAISVFAPAHRGPLVAGLEMQRGCVGAAGSGHLEQRRDGVR